MSVTAYRLGLPGRFRVTGLEEYLSVRGIFVQRVFAADLSSVSQERLRLLYSDRVCRAISGRSLTSGEVSATLGHRRMLRHFIASRSAWGLFFEDDAEPLEGLGAFAESLGAAEVPLFIDLFPVSARPGGSSLLFGVVAVRERRFPDIVSCGYALNRAAALALLSATKGRRVTTPPDWEPWWLGQCRFFEVTEAVVCHPPQGVDSILSIDRAPANARSLTNALRGLPGGAWLESAMRRAGVFAFARWIQGAPLRLVYLRDRGKI